MGLFEKLWENHPTHEYPCSTHGKKNFENQCAIRMGVCLERSGLNAKHWRVRRCWYHKADDNHILNAEELAGWLAKFPFRGSFSVEKYEGKEGFQKISGRSGIVFIRNFWGPQLQGDHIDLWNGWRLSSIASLVSIYTPWGSQYHKGEIWFWGVP